MAGPPKRNRKPSNSSSENDSDSEQHYLTQVTLLCNFINRKD